MSTTQRDLTLRELAREYAVGGIDRGTYRLRRARTLNELASYTPSPTTLQQQPQPTIAKRAARSQRPDEPKKSKTLIILPLTGLALLAVGGLLYVYFIQPKATSVAPTPDATPAETSDAKPVDRARPVQPDKQPSEEDPIKAFMARDDWRPEMRSRLIQHWQNLSKDQQARFSATSRFRAFSAELRNMIEEERGLAGDKDSAELDALTHFATRLGLDFSPVEENEPKIIPAAKPMEKNLRQPAEPEIEVPTTPPTSQETSTRNDTAEREVNQKVVPAAAGPPQSSEPHSPKANPPSASPPDQNGVDDMDEPGLETAPAPAGAEPRADTSSEEASVERALKQTSSSLVEENCRPVAGIHKIPKCRDRLKNGKNGPLMQLLPGGRFIMGRDEIKREAPAHGVNIGYPFAIGTYEVTQREYALFCKATDQTCPVQPWQDRNLPVVNVSRDDAKRYAEWLGMQSGKGYRLPTEAEWEYAARAGTLTNLPLPEVDLGTYAHYSDREKQQMPLPRRPQRTNPNQFGIFHMAGNVREWVLDSWSDDYSHTPRDGSPYLNDQEPDGIVRGGSYADGKSALYVSARQSLPRESRDAFTGFRIVRDVYPKSSPDELTDWGDWWLSFQRDDLMTIQLFATNRLEQVRQLINQHPRHTLKVVSSNLPTVKYLILQGLYASEVEADTAYRELPETLKPKDSKRVIKSIAALR